MSEFLSLCKAYSRYFDIGAAVNTTTIVKDAEILKQHFNSVTCENEMKYGRVQPEEGHFTFEDADKIVAFAKENHMHIRGHAPVWHNQTPDWFHLQGGRPAPRELVYERMDAHIKTVAEHFGDAVYCWDVVNEAVSDRTGGYRTEKSSWWNIYQSEEYIINAFRFANKYAPDELELYYNDYNECDKKKQKGIITLIQDVKAAEGTRIDGFGMQGHYSVNAPTAETIESAAREYAKVTDRIMLTELDVKHSMFYNGTDEGLEKEYIRQAKYYKNISDVMKKLHAEGVNVDGISLWGVSDRYTWLSGQHPLLFDKDLKPKPAFDAFIDKEE